MERFSRFRAAIACKVSAAAALPRSVRVMPTPSPAAHPVYKLELVALVTAEVLDERSPVVSRKPERLEHDVPAGPEACEHGVEPQPVHEEPVAEQERVVEGDRLPVEFEGDDPRHSQLRQRRSGLLLEALAARGRKSDRSGRPCQRRRLMTQARSREVSRSAPLRAIVTSIFPAAASWRARRRSQVSSFRGGVRRIDGVEALRQVEYRCLHALAHVESRLLPCAREWSIEREAEEVSEVVPRLACSVEEQRLDVLVPVRAHYQIAERRLAAAEEADDSHASDADHVKREATNKSSASVSCHARRRPGGT